MPFFSFSLKKNFLFENKFKHVDITQIQPNHLYYSKNTSLWRHLNNKKFSHSINSLSYEKRNKTAINLDSILFFLPPSLGLGDIIEYSLFVQAIINSNKFKKVGIAFIGKYKFILQRYFDIKNYYEDIIENSELNKYKTIFHITYQLDFFKKQKYVRLDIEQILVDYFNIKKIERVKNFNKIKIKKITIFPISQSPIRSMSAYIINSLIHEYCKDYEIDIVMDKNSVISNYLQSKIILQKSSFLYPDSLQKLSQIIEKIDFGIFMDSGPLHIAKILGKRGVLIETSVSNKKLLNDFGSIYPIPNDYKSDFCLSPCGLTNIFNYNGKSGCYSSLSITPKDFFKHSNLNSLQRGRLKDNYVDLLINPVGCIKKINIKNILNSINISLVK